MAGAMKNVNLSALLLDMEAPPLLQVNGNAPATWTAPPANAAHIPCSALTGSAA